jgi:deoxyadenosine/deoxycytidine kinase
MQNNLIFLGGPHGSGKTTLAGLIEKEIPELMIPELVTRTPKFYSSDINVDFFHRQALKNAQRAIENYEYLEFAKKNPDRIILGNRCFYDVLAYHDAYFNRGWINKEEKEKLSKEFNCMFSNGLNKPDVVILNPGFNVCKNHLHKRWLSKNKKFMEEDMDYLNAVCESYERFKDLDNVLYIDREIDMNDKGDLDGICEWIVQFNNSFSTSIPSYVGNSSMR